MNTDEQKISNERVHRIYRRDQWIHFFLISVILPVTVIAIKGYRHIWDTMFLFVGCALAAWTTCWINWFNSVIFAIAVPAMFIAIRGYRSIWETMFIFGLGGLIVWSRWRWDKKRLKN